MFKVIFVVMLVLVLAICAGCYVADKYESEEESNKW